MILPSRELLNRAIAAEANGNGLADAQPTRVPPLELELANSHITIADVVSPGADKAIVLTHASGGLKVVIPLPLAAAREIGNALCDRPNIAIPE